MPTKYAVKIVGLKVYTIFASPMTLWLDLHLKQGSIRMGNWEIGKRFPVTKNSGNIDYHYSPIVRESENSWVENHIGTQSIIL